MRVFFETGFDIVYLLSVIIIAIVMIKNSNSKEVKSFGFMALVLGIGDSFHLIPRMMALISGEGFEKFAYSLGTGKLVTSITMTYFYILLYGIYKRRYKVENTRKLDIIIYFLAVLRIFMCMLPQNQWTNYNQPFQWAVYRNIPFLIMGIIIIVLFYKAQKKYKDRNFKYMWLTIVLSFAFYIPVVIFSSINEKIGMLMIPKTLAYVWTVLIGFKEFKKIGEKNEKIN